MITLFINNLPSSTSDKVVNATGNKVTYFFKPPIDFRMKEGKKYEIRLISASIVYCTPNITLANRTLKYLINNVTHTFTFDVGLYSLQNMNMALSLFTMGTNNGNDPNLISFVPDEATSQIFVSFSSANVAIDCATSTVMEILGFPKSMGIIGNFLYPGGFVKGQKRANLNPIQSYLVQTNITTGNYLGSDSTSIIASVPINVSPFSTISYQPVHPVRTQINVQGIFELTVTLLDQLGNPVDMASNNGTVAPEHWSLVLSITEETNITL